MENLIFGFLTGGSLILAIGPQDIFVIEQGLKRNYIITITTICAFSDVFLIFVGIFVFQFFRFISWEIEFFLNVILVLFLVRFIWGKFKELDKRYFSQFGAVFIDEAHLAKAKSLTGIMTKLHDCKYRIGTTGTLDGTEVHRLVLEGLFNVHEQVTTTSELIERKELSQLHIRCLVLEHKDGSKRLMRGKTYQQEMEFISTNMRRNQFIQKLVCDCEGNTLVLAQYIEKQLVPLCDMIVDHCGHHRTIHLIYGATPTDDRERVRQLVEKENDSIIVASYGTFSTGVNIKRLHNIVFASPYKSQIKVLQSIGRGLRTAADKKQLNLFDISDDLVYNGSTNYTMKHMMERIQIYNSEGFDYDIVTVRLDK